MKEKEEPACFDGTCPVAFETLTHPDLRMLEARSLLVSLADMNIGEIICRKMDIDLDDLRLLAVLEEEIHKLTPAPSHGRE